MKSKTTYTCVLFCLLIYIVFWSGVSIGKSVTCINPENVHVTDNYDADSGEVSNIQLTYFYKKFEAEGLCSDDGERYVLSSADLGPFIEINDVGVFPVKKGKSDKLQIYFNNADDAENFGTQTVYVRRCEDDL